MLIGKLKKLKSITIFIIGLLLLIISFAPFLFVKELPTGNKGQLQGLFSMLWTVFTMIPAVLLTAAGFIIYIDKLIQSKFKLNLFLSIGLSALLLSKSSLLIKRFIPSFSDTMLNDIIYLIFGFFEFFLFYPSIIVIIIGIVLTIIKRKK
ncbi:MAG: hypothetical protein KC469_03955 [Flavobacteriaceae bacterium]|jgi:hypothetical protein|nr:hypothetical protein [Flavobacteriaceae bacterium]